MFSSTCSKHTPRAPIPDGRMERFMHPCHQKITSENSLKLQQQINGNLERKNLLSRGPNMTPGGLSYTEIQTYDIF